MKEVNGALASTLRDNWLESESQRSLASEGLQSSWWTVDTSRATPVWPRRLGMEHPEAAAEVEVEAGLGEVLSR